MSRAESYTGLTREQLIERLTAAEDVCVLFAWSPAARADAGDRELACLELWMRWRDIAGPEATSANANAHLSDEEIRVLSGLRRLVREGTVAKIRAVYEDGPQ